MAETGIMGSSGEFRTNSSSGGGSGAGHPFSQLGNMLGERAKRKQKMSHEQFVALQNVEAEKIRGASNLALEQQRGKNAKREIRAKGKQTRKTATTFAQLQETARSHAKSKGAAKFEGDLVQGTQKVEFRAPRERSASAKPRVAAPKPKAYDARNPHPKNPWDKATDRKEFTLYNKGDARTRSASMRRFNARGGK